MEAAGNPLSRLRSLRRMGLRVAAPLLHANLMQCNRRHRYPRCSKHGGPFEKPLTGRHLAGHEG